MGEFNGNMGYNKFVLEFVTIHLGSYLIPEYHCAGHKRRTPTW